METLNPFHYLLEKKFNRRERRAMDRSIHRKNNRKTTAGRHVQLVPKYSAEEINAAQSTVERLRRERSLYHIQHIC